MPPPMTSTLPLTSPSPLLELDAPTRVPYISTRGPLRAFSIVEEAVWTAAVSPKNSGPPRAPRPAFPEKKAPSIIPRRRAALNTGSPDAYPAPTSMQPDKGASVTSTDASIDTWNRIDPRSAPGG